MFAGLPTLAGCHCWLVATLGFVAGVAVTLLAALVGWLVRPLVAEIVHALLTPARARADCPSRRFAVAPTVWSRPDPLARRSGGRAPPLFA